MAGGMRIDNHSVWLGSKPKGTVFPDGPHKTKDESSAEGVGHVAYYEDTTEAIKGVQMNASKKVKGHPMKTGHFH
jgi:hypothetical protein